MDQSSIFGKTNVGSTERMASTVGGGLLIAYGLHKRGPLGLCMALLGGAVAFRGVTGHCQMYEAAGIDTAQDDGEIRVERAVTINKSPAEIYAFWRNFVNLPRFMEHLESVTITDSLHSHWVAKAPLGRTVEWDAEIINEIRNEVIAWRSLPGSDIYCTGSVNFMEATGGRGTVVKVVLEYSPPAGHLGAAIAKMLGEEPSIQIESDLRHLRQIMETGEIPTTTGQTSGKSMKRKIKATVMDSARSTANGDTSMSGLESLHA